MIMKLEEDACINLSIYIFEHEKDFYLYDFYGGIVLELNEEVYSEIKKVLLGENKIEVTNKYVRELLLSDIFCKKEMEEIIPLSAQKAYLSFAPTYQCNFRCSYCFGLYGQKYKGLERSFSKEKIRLIIDYFIKELFPNANQYRIDFVSGGEPLMGFEIIKEAILYVEKLTWDEKKQISVWLCTNGSLLSDEINAFLSNHNVSIGISIDGNKEYHDKNRVDASGRGTYDKIISNIQAIQSDKTLSKKYKDIWGLCTASNENCNFIELLKHFRKIGIKNVQIRLVRNGKRYDSELINKNYKNLSKFLLDSYKSGDEFFLNMILNDNDQFGKVLKRVLLNSTVSRRCNAGINKVTICPNGDIYPCDSLVGVDKFIIGNVENSTLDRSILNETDVYKRVKCKECELNVMCGGDCYYNSYINNGNICTPSEDFCKIQRNIINLSIVLRYKLEQFDSKSFEKFVNRLAMKEEYRYIYG